MKLIFLYGMPAVGKLTVAQELAAVTGFKLFHNHQVVDLLLTVFEFGSAPFVALREQFWLSVFEESAKSGLAGMIFTFNPESTVRAEFLDKTRAVLAAAGGEVEFVELTAPLEELKRRIGSKSRHQHKKLTSLRMFEELIADGAFEVSYMPKPRISVDTSVNSASRAVLLIARELGLLPVQ